MPEQDDQQQQTQPQDADADAAEPQDALEAEQAESESQQAAAAAEAEAEPTGLAKAAQAAAAALGPKQYIWGTGRRKKAIARVRIRPGSGQFLVNKRKADEYFPHEKDREVIGAPLAVTRTVAGWDVWANVEGGGYTGQAGAVALGLARALRRAIPEVESALRDHGLLTRDARMKERKKYGQPGARRRFQFSKR